VLTMVAPAVPRLVAARSVEPVVERAEELSVVFETAVPEGMESSPVGTVPLTGVDSSLLMEVELPDTGIDSTGIGSEDDSQESQTVSLEDTTISGLE